MNKRTLTAIVAAIGLTGGGALAISQLDSGRITNAVPSIQANWVDLGRTISRKQLRDALSNAANDRGYDINFNEVYRKGYRLGSVEETSSYEWTTVNISSGLMYGIDATIHGGNENASLYVRSYGLISDKEIRQYLNAVSNHLSDQ